MRSGWMPARSCVRSNAPARVPRPMCFQRPATSPPMPACRRVFRPLRAGFISRKASSPATRMGTRCCSVVVAAIPRAVTLRPSWRQFGWKSGPTSRACSARIRGACLRRGSSGACITTRLRKLLPVVPRCCIRAASCRYASTVFRCMSTLPRRPKCPARSSAPRRLERMRRV